jgi:hypothetical protein
MRPRRKTTGRTTVIQLRRNYARRREHKFSASRFFREFRGSSRSAKTLFEDAIEQQEKIATVSPEQDQTSEDGLGLFVDDPIAAR